MTHPLNVDSKNFPVRESWYYLNHAGVSPLPKPAADVVRAYAGEVEKEGVAAYGKWLPRLQQSRREAARLLNAEPEEVAFVKSTTLGLNNVAFGLRWEPGDVIVMEENTFPSNWYPWRAAEQLGAKTWVWPERNFRYDLEELEKRFREGGVRLLAATSANYGTGYRHDLEELGKLCRKYDVLFCLDAIQTLGVFPCDVKTLNVDFLSADSHKWLLGPESAGIMYVNKKRLPLFSDNVIGWLGRENFADYTQLDQAPDPTARRFEEGAPNVCGFMAMGESLKMINDVGPERIGAYNRRLCGVLEEGLEAGGWSIVSPRGGHASSIVCAQRSGVDVGRLVNDLKDEKIIAAFRRNSLRLSPHFYQTEDDMRDVVRKITR